MRVLSFLFLFFFSFPTFSRNTADTIAPYSYTRINKAYLYSYLTDGRDLLISPVHWKAPQWVLFGGTCAATGGLMLYADLDIKQYSQSKRTTLTNNLSTYGFERLGSGLYSFPFIAVMYGYGRLAHKDKPCEAALLVAKSLAFDGLIVECFKYGFQRERPRFSDDPHMFYGPFGSGKNRSFVSGHTSTAFTIATALALEYRDKPWVPILAYTLATGVGLSRIHDNRHWSSDVLFGAVLGFSVSRFLYRNQKKYTSR